MPFSLEFLSAVSQWQSGTNPDRDKQRRRALRLKELAAEVDERFRRTSLVCFRQITLSKEFVWKLGDELHLGENISSWTMDTEVAKHLKGGPPVPEHRMISIIFEHLPRPEEVVLNISSLYRDEEFLRECEEQRARIPSYGSGIATYANSQAEVVLEVDTLPLDAVYAFGGHSSSRDQIARQFFGHVPSPEEESFFDDMLRQSKRTLGANWVTDSAMMRVKAKMLATVEVLRPFNKASGGSESE